MIQVIRAARHQDARHQDAHSARLTMQRRVAAAAAGTAELPSKAELRVRVEDDEDDGSAAEPRAWHESLGVRAVLVLLGLFAIMHLFLWKVVYDFWMDQNHDRLNESVRLAWASLDEVRRHLEHFGAVPKEEL